MRAMLLSRLARLDENPAPLVPAERPEPVAGDGELLRLLAATNLRSVADNY